MYLCPALSAISYAWMEQKKDSVFYLVLLTQYTIMDLKKVLTRGDENKKFEVDSLKVHSNQ